MISPTLQKNTITEIIYFVSHTSVRIIYMNTYEYTYRRADDSSSLLFHLITKVVYGILLASKLPTRFSKFDNLVLIAFANVVILSFI